MDQRLFFGVGVSAVSMFGRYVFPTVPKSVAWGGLAAGASLIPLSFFPQVGPLPTVVLTLTSGLLAGAIVYCIAHKREAPAVEQQTPPTKEWMWPQDAAFYLLVKSTWPVNPELPENARYTAAAIEVTELAETGKVATEGRLRNSVEFEPLSPDFWLRARVDYDEHGTLFRVRPYDGQTPESENLVRKYDAFRFDAAAVKAIHPPKPS